MQQHPAAGIGAEPVGGGMAERDQPRVAEHEVEAHGEQAEDHRLGQQRHGERRQAERRQRPAPEPTTIQISSRDAAASAQASLPSRPPGRTTSTASITRYMKARAKSGT